MSGNGGPKAAPPAARRAEAGDVGGVEALLRRLLERRPGWRPELGARAGSLRGARVRRPAFSRDLPWQGILQQISLALLDVANFC